MLFAITTMSEHNQNPLISLGLKFRTNTGGFRKSGYVVNYPGGSYKAFKNIKEAEKAANEPEPIVEDKFYWSDADMWMNAMCANSSMLTAGNITTR